MPFESLDEFLSMGGHALYVWTAYGITFVVIGFLAVWPVSRGRRFLRQEAMRQRREQAPPARLEEPQ